jgi:hypothetical protein
MSELMKLIQEADSAAVEFEKARIQVEAAKQNLELAKEAHEQARHFLDEVMSRADDIGVPRAKIKKLIEERTQSLVASGLIPMGAELRSITPKAPRAPKKPKAAADSEKIDFDSAVGENDSVAIGLN